MKIRRSGNNICFVRLCRTRKTQHTNEMKIIIIIVLRVASGRLARAPVLLPLRVFPHPFSPFAALAAVLSITCNTGFASNPMFCPQNITDENNISLVSAVGIACATGVALLRGACAHRFNIRHFCCTGKRGTPLERKEKIKYPKRRD